MLQLFLTAIISFIVAFMAIPVIIHIADKKKLYDIPDERKLHNHSIASLGGIGIFLAVVFSCLVSIDFQYHSEFQYFLAAMFIMFFIGLKDDIIELSAFKKFVAQIVAASLVIYLGNIRIESLYGIFGVYEMEPMYGIPLTYIVIILIINAYNLIDGIDGLAGGLGLMATMLLGTYFYFVDLMPYAILSFSMSAALMAFLIFNVQPARIFMGDSGALLLGLVLSILTLKFINVASNPLAAVHLASAASIGVTILLIPLVDTIRVFSIRILHGQSPFTPDRNHIHHILLDKGLSHSSITLVCVSSNIIMIACTYFAKGFNNTFLLSFVLLFSFTVIKLLNIGSSHRKYIIQNDVVVGYKGEKTASKVIDLSTKTHAPVENRKG